MARSYNDLGVEFKYLIVNDTDRKFGLYINTVGVQAIRPNSPYPIKDHPSGYLFNAKKGRILREYQLLYITKGKGTFASDGTPERNIGKGNLIVLFPGQWHTYSPDVQTGWNEYYIGFEGSFIDQFVRNGFLSKEDQVLDIGLNEELVTLFSQALNVAETDKSASQQYLSGILLHIIGMIFSISKNKEFEKDNYNPQIQISVVSGTKRSIFRQKNKTKRSKKRLHTTLIKPEQKVNEDLCSGFIVS